MIIVEKDNRGQDYFVETIVATIPNEYYAKLICKLLMDNEYHESHSTTYYDLEKDDYVLRDEPFEP